MNKEYKLGLIIFRRDLRLHDNTALIAALARCESVIPLFIFDPRQVGPENSYKSENAIQFMITSLVELEHELKDREGKLYYGYGHPEAVVQNVIEHLKIEAVFVNRDYTPFSLKRDEQIRTMCRRNRIEFVSCNDALLTEPEDVVTKKGTPYQMYTPFFKAVGLREVAEPRACRATHFYHKNISGLSGDAIKKELSNYQNKLLHVKGGRAEGVKLLDALKKLEQYRSTRDVPSLATSNLSAHLKLGTISIREAYHMVVKKLGKDHPLVRQLFWRDFFYHVAYHSPFVFGQPYQEKYKNLVWKNNKKDFQVWCEGNTGFPIVDAGMRQLNATGYMHNRVRMIVASFLTKDLHIDWLWGERYFATKLVDYDPAVNNGNWQWAASTGCDAQPYFRIFNPWLQQKKFDSACEYIKKWVPELQKADAKIIHTLYKSTITVNGYPKPIVDHAIEQALAKRWYKKST